MFFVCLIFGFFFFFLFFFINFFLSFKLFFFSKNSSFESGFLSVGKIQGSFSVHFFLILLMFVIFDIEIVMVLGFLVSGYFSFFCFFLVFFFMLFGLYLEWYFNKLNWSL